MTLIEVMLATVMLLGCVMALSRVAFLARRHAAAAEDRTLAQTHCQNIMEELLAGIRPLRSVSPTAFEGGAWVYMVDVQPLDSARLAQVSVTVERLEDPEGMLPTEDEMNGFRLVRWVRSGQSDLDLLESPMNEDTPPPSEDAPEGDEGGDGVMG